MKNQRRRCLYSERGPLGLAEGHLLASPRGAGSELSEPTERVPEILRLRVPEYVNHHAAHPAARAKSGETRVAGLQTLRALKWLAGARVDPRVGDLVANRLSIGTAGRIGRI